MPRTLRIAAVLMLTLTAACTKAPRVRPVKGGDVDTGAGSVEATRRQLKGTWSLVSLQLFSPGGQPSAAEATGQLRYDEYGNMTIQATVAGSAAASIEPALLNASGRAAIDTAAHTITFQAVAAQRPEDRQIDPKLDASRVRYYELAGDVLKTTVKNASGSPVAVATWKKSE